ncbi:hypothetical protein BJG93_29815 (plasmid) [Paraburkholderia sprentiae WSM5005]|uniref:Uncharacterized protein n=1 Tax=Paraburkholderia sprentiae WSM5005 TaxID=754502 RepID=A0A1I9YU13_9BURK|nr:hypothetical protein [Paraburkholderia sprentiae]APA89678.1 hypothetical protein BJG93_29815 [Paraburkholderia sprentiae WSM5005]
MKANFKLLGIGIIAALAFGCTQSPSNDKAGIEIEALKKQVSDLTNKLQATQQTEAIYPNA